MRMPLVLSRSARPRFGCRRRFDRRLFRFWRSFIACVVGPQADESRSKCHQKWWKTPLPHAHVDARTEHRPMVRSYCGYYDVPGQVDGQSP